MFLARKILDKGSRLIFENYTAGTYTVDLVPNKYVISLIGPAGGNAAIWYRTAAGAKNDATYALGGVGGVIEVVVQVTQATKATIVVGAGGASSVKKDYASTNSSQSGAGANSAITGIEGLELVAGAGGGAYVAKSGYSLTITPGAQGTNVCSGTPVLKIVSNNKKTIKSAGGSRPYDNTPTGSVQTLNENWSDQQVGATGILSWSNQTWVGTGNGLPGGVKIRTATSADLS